PISGRAGTAPAIESQGAYPPARSTASAGYPAGRRDHGIYPIWMIVTVEHRIPLVAEASLLHDPNRRPVGGIDQRDQLRNLQRCERIIPRSQHRFARKPAAPKRARQTKSDLRLVRTDAVGKPA